MSDDFIPLNQSTPRGKFNRSGNFNQSGHGQQNNRFHGNKRGGGHHNKWNNSRNSSFGSDSNSSFNQSQDRNSIDAYLHPSMLQDPWAKLRQQQSNNID